MIATRDFLHEQDEKLTQRIFSETFFKSWVDRLHTGGLDKVCDYVYGASLPEIPQGSLTVMCDIACQEFGMESVALRQTRNYEPEVLVVGYNTPSILITDSLIDCADEEILQARLYAAAAAIAAGHHKLKFFIWAAENMSGVAGLPIFGKAILAVLYEWNRVRQFSLDRAVLLATGDFSLALKNILFGVVPNEILKNFDFGTNADTFNEQMRRYFGHDDPAQLVGKIFGYLTDYSWLPRRYDELKKFQGRRGLQ